MKRVMKGMEVVSVIVFTITIALLAVYAFATLSYTVALKAYWLNFVSMVTFLVAFFTNWLVL